MAKVLSWEEVTRIMAMRREEDSALKRDMIEIRDRYNSDIAIPLSDVKGQPVMDSPVPAIIAETIDGLAMQAASTRPMIAVPSLDFSDPESRERANRRRRGYYDVWHRSQFKILSRRAYRHIGGYGVGCLMVEPCFKTKMPKLALRDPLTAYPDTTSPEEIRLPENVGFIVGRSPDWIRMYYPEAIPLLGNGRNDLLWDMLEWIDRNQVLIGILGPRESDMAFNSNRGAGMLLRRWDNPTGIVPAVVPHRLTMDKIAGQVSRITGMIDIMGRLMALEIIAAERGVFPDRYVIARPNMRPVIADGRWKDGREGETNILENVEAVGQLAQQVGPSTPMALSYLERSARMSGGTPGIFGGELTGAIRSGQTILQAGAYSVDPRIQEMQETMEYTMEEVNRAIYTVYKGYFPRGKYTVFSGMTSDNEMVEVDVARDFESDDNTVYYPFPGADANAITVAVGQALGAGLMSRHTAMAKHPFVEDAEFEMDQQIKEQLVDALRGAVAQGVVSGSLAEIDVVEIIEAIDRGEDFPAAVRYAHEEAQRRQAQMAPTPEPGAGMAPGMAPEMMSGISQPGAGAEMQPPESVQPPPQSAQNFRELVNAIRQRA